MAEQLLRRIMQQKRDFEDMVSSSKAESLIQKLEEEQIKFKELEKTVGESLLQIGEELSENEKNQM